MNAVVVAVCLMLLLAVLRVHVVLALFIGALVGGVLSGMGLEGTMVAFQEGLGAGAKIALSYALLGAFAMAVAHSGLPRLLADWMLGHLRSSDGAGSRKRTFTRWAMLAGICAMAVMSQNLIPVHIAFIPLLIPPLLVVMNNLRLDRRAVACVLTFGLVTTYMFLPIGFGKIFLTDILLGNIAKAGMDVSGINVMSAMAIPAAGMVVGLLLAVFVTYRKPREYRDVAVDGGAGANGAGGSGAGSAGGSGAAGANGSGATGAAPAISRYRIVVSLVAILVCFGIQLALNAVDSDADALLVGALVGLCVFIFSRAVKLHEADDVFTDGMKMMALIGFIMISAQGFANVMSESGQIEPLVHATAAMFGSNKAMASLAMLLVGLLVTMGIGSSFSTLPIIAAIYVPLCATLGFSPLATVSIIGTAGALGDAGSPASDSTLGPTAGLNADGQHDHIRDSVIPTFIHFNIPLLIAGWVASLVL
ncbi:MULTISPECIES: Na+/H+ antiporter family protein [Actinotignum]|uniref:Na+/H+ antiporter family protein n=1 Tax=Actinotignum TaxID=1653174 RepID=UPI002550EB14|nr:MULTISPECIES: Na+/H+ antiporter family protein [Actinotignum]MDE1536262.1 Na+/H+ antiporter family protein [Actinotignum schaalii]MDK7272086.1 Na+/H+ antiporter family protein [Actinotignum schaalii]MDY5144840.1 Na+/H+ antiporter family protein [Actinotignum timonense]